MQISVFIRSPYLVNDLNMNDIYHLLRKSKVYVNQQDFVSDIQINSFMVVFFHAHGCSSHARIFLAVV